MSTLPALPSTNGPTQALARAFVNPVDSFEILDVYAGGLVADEQPRPDAIATISAGFREAPREGRKVGFPAASRDGRIFLHDESGRAPGLKAALEATDFKRLTVAFPFDDPHRFIQMRFMAYSQTRLLAYGDEQSIHTIKVVSEGKDEKDTVVEHADWPAGSAQYARAVADCKVSVSVYFALADWIGEEPIVVFPDGVGALYRLRFTSRHSLRSLRNTLRETAEWTRGKLAGVPFELSIDYREVADAKGAKRRIPVWAIATKPPSGLMISSRNYKAIMQAALASGEALMLPAPRAETIDMALGEAAEPDLDDLSEEQAELLQRGGRCDAAKHEREWFANVHGTALDEDERRARWFRAYTNGQTDSLAAFLAAATEAEAAAMILQLKEDLGRVNEVASARDELKRVGVELPSAVETRTLERNQFIALAMERYDYDGKLAIAKALGLVTLNAWLTNGRTWNDALDRLEAIHQAQQVEVSRAPDAEASEAAMRPGDEPEDDGEFVQGFVEELEDDRAVGMADEDFERELEEDDPQYLMDLWSTLHTQRGIAGRVGVKLGPIPSGENVTPDQLREAIQDLGRKIAAAQAQESLI